MVKKKELICQHKKKQSEAKICGKKFNCKSELKKHLKSHGIGVIYTQCGICNKKMQNRCLKRHLKNCAQIPINVCCVQCKIQIQILSLNRHLKTCGQKPKMISCPKCEKNVQKINLNQHLKIHEEKTLDCHCCNKKFNHVGLKIHLDYKNNKNWSVCTFPGCTTKQLIYRSNKYQHNATHHAPKIKIKCPELNCNSEFLKTSKTQHYKQRHKDTFVFCKEFECKKKGRGWTCYSKNQHYNCWHKHHRFFCAQENCHNKTFATSRQLSIHMGKIHNIGRYKCPTCFQNFHDLKTWENPNTNEILKICNSCITVANNANSPRIEKQIVKWLKENFAPPISQTDKTVLGDFCGKKRPDIAFLSHNLIIYVEIDENQHCGYQKSCEESRMSEIACETLGTPVVFIRYNPHKYYSPKNVKNLNCEKTHDNNLRKKVLLETLKYIATRPNSLTLEVFYLFYSENNFKTKIRFPNRKIYCLSDLK